MSHTRSKDREVIALKNASKRIGEQWVFKDIDLAVNAGEIAALIGPSGAGKTLAIRCLTGFEPLTSGDIYLDGKPVLMADIEQLFALRSQVGIVFQQLNLWPYRQAISNIMEGLRYGLGLPHFTALRRAATWGHRLGLNSHLRQFPATLSGGEQQRVAIARAMAMAPRILLLDEITSMVDPIIAGQIGDIALDLRRSGVGILFVTHQIAFVQRHADWVYFLQRGKIVESGPAREVLRSPKTDELRHFIQDARKGW